MAFPKNFLWGTATSAGQIEGGVLSDGRTPSIWDTMAQKPGKIFGGHTPEIACDSYHQFDRDLKNLCDLGVNSYRLSISWSRVMPNGTGEVNQAGIDYYRRAFEALLQKGQGMHNPDGMRGRDQSANPRIRLCKPHFLEKAT